MQIHPDVQRVMHECARWGVGVEIVDTLELSEVSFAAPHVGLREPPTHVPTVLVRKPGLDRRATAPELLHELAHLIIGEHADDVDEVHSGMLAYEYRAARRLRLGAWGAWMEDYVIDAQTWGASTKFERRNVVQRSLRNAKRAGIMDGRGATFRRRLFPQEHAT